MKIEGTAISPQQLNALAYLYMLSVKPIYLMHKFSITFSELVHLTDLGLMSHDDSMCSLTNAGNKYVEFCLETSNANISS